MLSPILGTGAPIAADANLILPVILGVALVWPVVHGAFGAVTEALGVYIALAAATPALARKVKFCRWKLWMRMQSGSVVASVADRRGHLPLLAYFFSIAIAPRADYRVCFLFALWYFERAF